MAPEIRYAKSGEISVAYEVVGDGPIDLVIAPGFVSHLEISWENPRIQRFAERLAKFARVITFDKRGTGMSDPVEDVPTLEDRMDDIRAVMDAAGSERAVLVGISEGATMCILFAAAHPERTAALVLYGGMARSMWAPDYPWPATEAALTEALAEFTVPGWGTGDNLDTFAPSLADDPAMRQWWARMERFAASPSMMAKVFQMFLETDVRDALLLVHVPTLVLHQKGDRVVNVGAGRFFAEQIEGAKFVEFESRDHAGWAGDVDTLIGEVEEFLTGARTAADTDLDRVLATVMFVDLVGSTAKAAELGDQRWRDFLDRDCVVVRRGLERFRGREIKAIGDGFLCVFDGPARAIRAAQSIASGSRSWASRSAPASTPGSAKLIGDDVGGIAVHIGARVVSIADPGAVLVSSTVKDLVAGSGIEFADRGAHTLKGVPGEWRLSFAGA